MAGIEAVNALDFEEFIGLLGNAVEHFPVLAGAVWARRPFRTVSALHTAFTDNIDLLPVQVQCGILRCHPDLAGRLAQTGELSADSAKEQTDAGLLGITDVEKNQLQTHNVAYKRKFGFPFIICVRENKKEAIMTQIELRLQNDPETEIAAGIEEVKKICFLRLCDIVGVEEEANL